MSCDPLSQTGVPLELLKRVKAADANAVSAAPAHVAPDHGHDVVVVAAAVSAEVASPGVSEDNVEGWMYLPNPVQMRADEVPVVFAPAHALSVVPNTLLGLGSANY